VVSARRRLSSKAYTLVETNMSPLVERPVRGERTRRARVFDPSYA